jgi:hypothetical protein
MAMKAIRLISNQAKISRQASSINATSIKSTKERNKKVLDALAEDFNISEPKDWGKITKEQIIDKGAHFIPMEGSLRNMLQSVYSGEWIFSLPL